MSTIIIPYNQIPYEVFKHFVFQFIQIPPNDFIKMRIINKDFYEFILKQLPKILSFDSKIRIHWKFAKTYPDFIPTKNVSFYDYTTNGHETTINTILINVDELMKAPICSNMKKHMKKQKISKQLIKSNQKAQSNSNNNIFSHQTISESFIVRMMKLNEWQSGDLTISQFFQKYPN